MERCPLCHAPLSGPQAVTRCGRCGTPAHAGCLSELGEGRCPVLGCARAAPPAPVDKPTGRPWRVVVVGALAALLVIGGWVIAVERANRRPEFHPPPFHHHPHDESVPPDLAHLGSDADLSHVRVGQRYRYVLTNPGAPPLEMEYRVTDVGRNLVAYEHTTLMDIGLGLAPIGPPTPQEWSHHPSSAAVPSPALPQRTERVRVGDVEFDCWVVVSDNTVAWVPERGGVPVFPGLVRLETEGQTTMELTEVTGP
ncbi:MAG: E3 ubiquitin protein ligase [Planctomycetes bacterium]|nr:E3 ubiquitin protein ligase [Planctomycetota bacterium]